MLYRALFYIFVSFSPLYAGSLTWQEKTIKELEWITQQIEENHPGACDAINDPKFSSLLAQQKSAIPPEVAKQIKNEEEYAKCIVSWVAAYHDNHLYIKNDTEVSSTTAAPSITKINNDTYLIKIPSFKGDNKKSKQAFLAIEKQLKNLRSKKEKTIIFDIRGNKGGDTNNAEKLFTALTGTTPPRESLYEPDIKETDVVLAYRQSNGNNTHFANLYKKNPNPFLEIIIKKLSAAKEQGLCLATLNFAELKQLVATPSEKIQPIRGNHKTIIITDQNNKSAALDFCELLLLLPNTIQIGETTSADSTYSEVRPIALQFSSKTLFIPTSISFKTKRKPNTPYKPTYGYHGKTIQSLKKLLNSIIS